MRYMRKGTAVSTSEDWGYLIPENDQSKSHAAGSPGFSGVVMVFWNTEELDLKTD